MLTEKQIIGKIEILEDGQIQVRTDTVIMRDDIEITRQYHRRVLAPGDNIDKEDTSISTVANVIWTKDVVEAYMNKLTTLKEIANGTNS